MRCLYAGAMLAVLPFACSGAGASIATGSFNVQVTIASTCAVDGATAMNFGPQGVLSANVNQTSTVSVSCTNTTPYNIGFDKGLNGSSVTSRQMKSAGGALINYSLFSDPGMTANWGNTVGTDTVTAAGNGSAQAFIVYGQIPAQVTPAPAAYTDTITVTVTY